MGIAKNLHFDMARFGDVFFDQDVSVAEACLALALAIAQKVFEILFALDKAHAFAAAARHRLDEHGIADFSRLFLQEIRVLIVALITRHNRYACLLHDVFGAVFQTHRGDGLA